LPIEIINGNLTENEIISNNGFEIGKILISKEYPFALVKYLDKNFDEKKIYNGKNSTFRIFLSKWFKI